MRTMKIRLLLPLLVVVLLPVHSVRAQIDVRLTKAAAPAVAPLTASGAADGATFTPLSLRTVGEFGGRIQNVAVSSDGNFAYVGMEQTVAVIDLNQNPEPAQLGVTRILGGLVIDVAVNGHTVYAVVYSGGLYAIDAADPANPTVVGFYPSPAARGVDVVGNLAYLSSAGLTILDVSQPGHPVAVGVLPIPEYVLGVTVSGHYAYVATQGSLRILDVANPTSPFEVGSVAVEGARATAVMNGFAYVVQVEDGFAVVNVSNPGAPAVVEQVALPGYTYDISVLGQHLFVAGERHLRTFDVTTSSQPTATGIYYTRQEPVGLAVRNNVVYVAALSAGLHIVDATDLLMMREVGRQDTPGQASGIALAGSHAYVADGAQGLRILSLTSPAQPQEVGFYDTPGFAENVAVVGTRAYIADGRNPDTWQVSGLRIIDVSNPAHPTELGSIQTPDDANDVFVVGALVYVAARESGLRIIDAANPASPQEIGFVDTPGDAVAVAVTTQPSGTYALVADTIYGVRIIDVSNPAQPQEISHLPQNLGGEWNSVVVRGNYAYVTESYWQWDGLYVMDISDPSAPEFVGFAPAERALGVMLVGDRAYVGGSQLTVFDLADPVRPIELGAYESPGRVAVQQALAYQAAGNDGVRVVDVQNLSTPVRAGNLVNGPVVDVAKTGAYGLITGDASLRVLSLADAQHPQLVGRLATTTPTNRIVVSGNYAYATQRAVLDHNLNAWTGGGLRIVNVSNPLAPAGRGFFATPDGSGLGPVAVAGHYVYAVSIDIFTPGADFYAIDVANPDAPMQVGRYSVPAGITNMAVKGPYAYLLTESGTLRIIGLANPAQLVEVSSLAIPSDATSLAVTDHYVIIGFDSSDGLHIVDVANPAAPSLVRTLTAIGGIEAMSIHGHNLYTARFANIAMVDLSNPLRPLASAYRTVPASQDRASIVADGDTVYLPQDTDGLLIFKTTPLTRSLNLPLIVGSF